MADAIADNSGFESEGKGGGEVEAEPHSSSIREGAYGNGVSSNVSTGDSAGLNADSSSNGIIGGRDGRDDGSVDTQRGIEVESAGPVENRSKLEIRSI